MNKGTDATARVTYNFDCLDLGITRKVVGKALSEFALVDISGKASIRYKYVMSTWMNR